MKTSSPKWIAPRYRPWPFLLALASIALIDSRSPALSQPAPAEDPRAALFQAVGGLDAVRGLDALSFALDGASANALQGYSAAAVDNPAQDGHFAVRGAFDLAKPLIAQENVQEVSGGLRLHFGATYKDGVLRTKVFAAGYYADQAVERGPALAQLVDLPSRYLPPLFLRRLLDSPDAPVKRAEDPRYLSVGKPEQGLRIRLAEDGLGLAELLAMQPDPLDGRTEVSYRYFGNRRIKGLVFPERIEVWRRGRRALELYARRIEPGRGPTEGDFATAGLRKEDVPTPPVASPLGDGIYEVRGVAGGPTYRGPLLLTSKEVVVFDAPANPASAKDVLAAIRKVSSGLPIRFLVLSHFHADHASGAVAYADEGVEIWVPSGSAAVVQRYLAAAGKKVDPARIREIKEKTPLPLLDTGRVVEVLPIAGTPHVEAALVVHDRRTRTLFEGDLFSDLTPFNQNFAFFADWVESQRLDVDRIVGIHHPPLSRGDIMARRRAFGGFASWIDGK